jgi:hypothetical protein
MSVRAIAAMPLKTLLTAKTVLSSFVIAPP